MKNFTKQSSTQKIIGFRKRISYLSKNIGIFGLLAFILGKMQICYDLFRIIKPLQAEVQFYHGFMFAIVLLLTVNMVIFATSFVCAIFSSLNKNIEQ